MLPGVRLDILVLVLHSDGSWREGFLEHWRRDGDRWCGFVRYSVGVGMTHIGWFDEALIQGLPEEPPPYLRDPSSFSDHSE